MQKAKEATNNGCVFLFPIIFEPSHRITASQKTYIMIGAPKPDMNKNAVDKVVKMELIIAASDLNQRFKRRMRKRAVSTATIIDGSLIVYSESPKKLTQAFCSR